MLWQDQHGACYVEETTPELSMALLPQYRGKGSGSQLLARLLEAAKRHYVAICLRVASENPAKNLYQRTGFGIVSENENSFTLIKR